MKHTISLILTITLISSNVVVSAQSKLAEADNVKAQSTSAVRISGTFPAVEGLSVILSNQSGDFEPIELNLQAGSFDVEIPELTTGIYRLTFRWPDNVVTLYRDREGVVRETKSDNRVLIKSFYVNPDQSDHYQFALIDDITAEEFLLLDGFDLIKTKVFYMQTISTSLDAQVYEKLDRLDKEYRSNYAHIRDSLFAAGTQADKIPVDFQEAANAVNYENYYPIILAKKREVMALHPESPVSVWAVLSVQNDDLRKESAAYEALLKNMRGRAKESDYFYKANAKLISLIKIQEGNKLEMPNGNTPEGQKLDYNPGDYSYTLVEFWASWCGPCRQVNPSWNKLLETYRHKGFQILGVSLDEQVADWKKAIEDDQLNGWVHISDLEHPMTGGNATKYGIESIPYNILIDNKGLIIHKNIKPGALEKFIIENLN